MSLWLSKLLLLEATYYAENGEVRDKPINHLRTRVPALFFVLALRSPPASHVNAEVWLINKEAASLATPAIGSKRNQNARTPSDATRQAKLESQAQLTVMSPFILYISCLLLIHATVQSVIVVVFPNPHVCIIMP